MNNILATIEDVAVVTCRNTNGFDESVMTGE
jgi:hypothetical protein